MRELLLLLAAAGLLAIAAWWTTRLLVPDSLLDAAVTFGVVAAAGIAVTLLAAGSVGLLTPAAVLALHAAWALGAAALVGRVRPPRVRLPRPSPAAIRRHPWECALVAVAAVALAWQLLVALVLPPFAFDALTYHLTIVATWVREANLDPAPLSLCCARYPATSELMFSWPVLLLGNDSLVDTVQFGFVLLGAFAVAGITRSAGLPRASAAAAAALFATTPIVLAQAPTDYADVMVASCALAGLHALVRFATTGARGRLVVAGLASGLVLGTKGTGIVWAAALGVIALTLVVARARAGRMPRRAALEAAAVFTAACLALGSYWYARNWIDTGNPVFPFQVRGLGTTVFDGPVLVQEVLTKPDSGSGQPWPVSVVRSWAADIDFWHQGSYDHQQRQGGLGPLWVWLALPLLVPLTVALIRRRSPALVALAGVALVLLVQPYRWWARFTIPLMGVGALAVVAAAVWAPSAWMRRSVRVAALALVLAGVALASYQIDPAGRARPLPARELVDLIGAPREERTIGRLFYPEYRFLEAVPDDATVAVDLRAPAVRFVYPLFGPGHSREVVPAGAGAGPPPPGAWVVTGAGRPLDRRLSRDPRFSLAAATRGVRVWRPAP